MTIDTTYTMYGLLISNALLLAAATIAVLRLQRMRDQYDAFWSSPTGKQLSERSEENGISHLVEERIQSLQETVDKLVRSGGATQIQFRESLPMENAVRMAKRGASIDDITRNCGLSASEAKLLMRVHSDTETSHSLN